MRISEIRSWLNRNAETVYKVMAFMALLTVLACTFVAMGSMR